MAHSGPQEQRTQPRTPERRLEGRSDVGGLRSLFPRVPALSRAGGLRLSPWLPGPAIVTWVSPSTLGERDVQPGGHPALAVASGAAASEESAEPHASQRLWKRPVPETGNHGARPHGGRRSFWCACAAGNREQATCTRDPSAGRLRKRRQ